MHLAVRAFACFLLALPLAAQKVTVDFDKDADFSKIHRYQWRAHPALENHPELREQYSVGIQLVLDAGNRQLAKKGLRPSDGPPDVFVTFFITAQANQELKTITDFMTGGWYPWYGVPTWTHTEIDYYVSGLLVLDIVDAATSKLIWRAYASDNIRDMKNRDKNIDATVRKALDRFPPKQK